MKFLRAVSLRAPDPQLFPPEGALEDGAWVVSGGFALCDLLTGVHRQPACRCDVSFIGLDSRKRCGIAEVVEIDEITRRRHVDTLTRHLLTEWGAPSEKVARDAAEDEVAYTVDLCDSFAPEVWITVQRMVQGDALREHYSVFKRLLIGDHQV